MNRLFTRLDNSAVGRWWWTVDRLMLAAIIILVICGVMLVATASPPVAMRIGVGQYHFIKRHLVMLLPALFIMFSVSLMSPKMIWRTAAVVFGCGVLAMIAVLFVGVEIKGAQRWLSLPGFSLQPSEFIKPAFAIVAARFLSKQKEESTFRSNAIAAGLYALVVGLLMSQPDFGMTTVVTCIFGAQVFLAGIPWVLVIGLVALAGVGGVSAYFLFDHIHSRVNRFLDPSSGDTYQVDKALEAFRNGGLFGTGAGQGTVKLSLPDAHADFIFAVGAEEMGLLFALFIVVLFAFILRRGFSRVMDSDNLFIVLAATGLLTMFGLQAVIHMGSSLHLLPAKGMTLPFISYGGSSLMAVGFSLRAILALTRRQMRRGAGRMGSIARGGLVVAGQA